MTDRVHPSSKPTTITNPPPNSATNGGATATKPQLYNPTATRHPYRPHSYNHRHRRTRRRCSCCCCLFWLILLLLLVALIAATAAAAFWLLYKPQHPTFSVSILKVSTFNLTTSADSASSHLTTSFNLSLSTTNPNKNIPIFYDPFTVTLFSKSTQIANGSFPSFTSNPKNTTPMRIVLSESQDLDTESVTELKSDLKKKNGLTLRVELDTRVKVKMNKVKTKKIGIRITCDNIHGVVPKSKSSSAPLNLKCEVDLRIKIWKWTF